MPVTRPPVSARSIRTLHLTLVWRGVSGNKEHSTSPCNIITTAVRDPLVDPSSYVGRAKKRVSGGQNSNDVSDDLKRASSPPFDSFGKAALAADHVT
jgi:hypothetical protein